MKFQFIHEIDQLNFLAKEWNRLALLVPSPLMTFEWIISAAEAFYPRDKLYIGVLFDGTVLRGIAPLVSQGKGPLRRLRLIGPEYLGEPCGILCDSKIAFKTIIMELERQNVPIYLERTPIAQTKTAFLNRRNISFNGIRLSKHTNFTRYLPITTNWKAFWASLPSKRRNDIRRARRRAETQGNLCAFIQCPSLENIESELSRAFQIEHNSWKGQNGTSINADERLNKFFTKFGHRAQIQDWLRIGFLKIGDYAVAATIGLEFGNNFWLLKVGYDHQWAKCSPGILLITECIRYAFDRQLQSFEFLGSDESWLRTWVRDEHSHEFGLFAYYPFCIPGFLNLATDVVQRLKSYSVNQK